MAFILFLQLFFSQFQAGSTTAVEISGVVMDAATKRPVDKAYIYTIKGEEEAVSDAGGHFKFISWQKKPLDIYVSHYQYKNKIVRAESNFKDLKIEITNR